MTPTAQQLDLTLEPAPLPVGYARGRATSKAAADQVRPTVQTRRARVLEVIRQLGEATPDEVAAVLGVAEYKIRPRFTELRKLGMIEETGEKRPTGNGGEADVLRARAA